MMMMRVRTAYESDTGNDLGALLEPGAVSTRDTSRSPCRLLCITHVHHRVQQKGLGGKQLASVLITLVHALTIV